MLPQPFGQDSRAGACRDLTTLFIPQVHVPFPTPLSSTEDLLNLSEFLKGTGEVTTQPEPQEGEPTSFTVHEAIDYLVVNIQRH